MQGNTSSKIELYGMTEAEMRQAFSALGYPAFRGSQVFKHLYEETHFPDGAASVFGTMTDVEELIAQAAASRGGNEEDYMDMTVTSAVKNHGATVALALKAVFAGKFDAFGGRSDRLGVISADPEENAVQLAASSTQFGDGFTKEDYAALTAKLFNGELTVDDDVEKAPADFATVITVEDVGNVK